MDKTVLIVGKELPNAADFASGLKNKNFKSLIADGKTIVWNKSSPISARTLILQSANLSEKTFDVVLYLDEQDLATTFTKPEIQTCTQINDEFIISYQYIVIELLQYFKTHPGNIVFIHRELPKTIVPSCFFIKAAGAAFESLAESTALSMALPSVHTVLVRTDGTNEDYKNDSSLAEWLCSYLDALKQTKAQPNSKHIAWIKPGSKPSSGFPLFH